jgi:molybdate transport system substrate-binding protein
MAKLTDADLVDGDPVDFATNVLEIAVPPTNPAGIETFADLAAPGLKLVICAPEVPCGAATVKVEQASGLTLSPVSEESSVTDVLGKVTSGEADAGLVYVTDVIAAGDAVEGIEFDESAEAVNTYPIAALTDADASNVAAAFVAFITSEAGQPVLSAAGFGLP